MENIKKTNPAFLEDNAKLLNKSWTKRILFRMGYVKHRENTTAKIISDNFDESLRETYLEKIRSTVKFEDIPLGLIFNWDQTGLNYVPVSNWTMEKKGAKSIEIKGLDDKRQITAVFGDTLTVEFLYILLVYQGSIAQCHPNFKFPDDSYITHSDSNETAMVNFIAIIIFPFVKRKHREVKKINDQAALIPWKKLKMTLKWFYLFANKALCTSFCNNQVHKHINFDHLHVHLDHLVPLHKCLKFRS